jgi:hypothetical protein
LGADQFFHQSGVDSADRLISLVYDLAYFWKVDPDNMMGRPMDALLESFEQAHRILNEQQVG